MRRCSRSWEGPWPGEQTPARQSNVPYHRMPCPVYNWGCWLGEANRCLGIGQWEVSDCAVHHSPFLGFCFSLILLYSFSWLLLLYFIDILYYYYTLVQLLDHSYFNRQVGFWGFFSPISSPTHWEREEWVSGCVVRSCWLELNHNIWFSRNEFYLLARVSSSNCFQGVPYLPVSATHFQFSHPYIQMEMQTVKMPVLIASCRAPITKCFLRWCRQWLSSNLQHDFPPGISTAQEIAAANTCKEVCWLSCLPSKAVLGFEAPAVTAKLVFHMNIISIFPTVLQSLLVLTSMLAKLSLTRVMLSLQYLIFF